MSERPVCLAGADRALTRGGADVTFTDGIADADDHSTLTSLKPIMG